MQYYTDFVMKKCRHQQYYSWI